MGPLATSQETVVRASYSEETVVSSMSAEILGLVCSNEESRPLSLTETLIGWDLPSVLNTFQNLCSVIVSTE